MNFRRGAEVNLNLKTEDYYAWQKVRETFGVFSPLYKEHLNHTLTESEAEEIRDNLKGFFQALKYSLKDEDHD